MGFLDWLGNTMRPRPPRPKPPPPSTGFGQDLLAETNAARAAKGLPPYAANGKLDAMAAEHAHGMAASGVLSHKDFQKRLDRSGYKYSTAAENVACGQETAKAAVVAWENSPGHAANMFGDYVDAGGGSAQAGGVWYWCAVYASPR